MLVGSGVRLSASNPMRQFGAQAAGSAERAAWSLSRRSGLAAFARQAGLPYGVRHPAAWALPRVGGALVARNEMVVTTSTGTLLMASGRNIDGAVTISLTVPGAALQLIVSAAGSTTITITASAGLVGSLAAVGAAPITVTVPTATLGALADMAASSGVTLSAAAGIRAIGHMAGDISPFTALSPENLAAAVWNAAAAGANAPGTMGEKLNDAGSGTNPWTEVIEPGFTAAEVLRLLAAVAAGKTDIVDLGGGNATVKFRNLGDTKDRVVATMAGSERATVTRDLT